MGNHQSSINGGHDGSKISRFTYLGNSLGSIVVVSIFGSIYAARA